MKSVNIVDCPNNHEVIVRERAIDEITRTFAFDKVFGPSSRQVSMSVYIYLFFFLVWYTLLLLLLLLLLF
jgi:hypothetical protein